MWTEHRRTSMCTKRPGGAGLQQTDQAIGKIIRTSHPKSDEDPVRSVEICDGGVTARQPDRRPVGRLRGKWQEDATGVIWQLTKEDSELGPAPQPRYDWRCNVHQERVVHLSCWRTHFRGRIGGSPARAEAPRECVGALEPPPRSPLLRRLGRVHNTTRPPRPRRERATSSADRLSKREPAKAQLAVGVTLGGATADRRGPSGSWRGPSERERDMYMCVHTQTYWFMCMNMYMFMRIHMFAPMYLYVYIIIFMCMCMCICFFFKCVRICVYAFMYTRI